MDAISLDQSDELQFEEYKNEQEDADDEAEEDEQQKHGDDLKNNYDDHQEESESKEERIIIGEISHENEKILVPCSELVSNEFKDRAIDATQTMLDLNSTSASQISNSPKESSVHKIIDSIKQPFQHLFHQRTEDTDERDSNIDTSSIKDTTSIRLIHENTRGEDNSYPAYGKSHISDDKFKGRVFNEREQKMNNIFSKSWRLKLKKRD